MQLFKILTRIESDMYVIEHVDRTVCIHTFVDINIYISDDEICTNQ